MTTSPSDERKMWSVPFRQVVTGQAFVLADTVEEAIENLTNEFEDAHFEEQGPLEYDGGEVTEVD